MPTSVRSEASEAIRALRTVETLAATCAARGGSDPVMDILVALEAARTAGAHIGRLVPLLADEALSRGATAAAIGFTPDLND